MIHLFTQDEACSPQENKKNKRNNFPFFRFLKNEKSYRCCKKLYRKKLRSFFQLPSESNFFCFVSFFFISFSCKCGGFCIKFCFLVEQPFKTIFFFVKITAMGNIEVFLIFDFSNKPLKKLQENVLNEQLPWSGKEQWFKTSKSGVLNSSKRVKQRFWAKRFFSYMSVSMPKILTFFFWNIHDTETLHQFYCKKKKFLDEKFFNRIYKLF